MTNNTEPNSTPINSVFYTASILFISLLILPFASASVEEDLLWQFKSWFNRYKKGDIDLYQSSPVPITQGKNGKIQYFRTETVEEMDSLLAGLAKLNNVKATRLLVETASFRFDRKPKQEIKKYFKQQPWMVRSHAVRALQKITDPEALEWLRSQCLENNSGWEAPFRKIIAASVLKNVNNKNTPTYIKSLFADKNSRVREEALFALKVKGSAADLDSVIKLLNDKELSVKVAAIETIGAIFINMGGKSYAVVDKLLPVITSHLHDPEWRMQEAVLSLLEKFRSVRTIPLLIDFMDKVVTSPNNYRERIIQQIGETLRSLTGEQIGGLYPDRWRKWWIENQDSFQMPPAPPASIKGFQLDTSYFFNIPVNSDYVYFILDISGSMRAPLSEKIDPTSDLKTKLDRARSELAKTLESLDPDARFNIVLFNDSIHLFSKTPVKSTKDSIEKAKRFFEEAVAEGGTNIFDALNSAFNIKSMGLINSFDENIQFDTIFLLSDGVPTAGLVIDPKEIFQIITNANRHSKIKINTVFLGTDVSRFMFDLADNNFGKFVHIK